MTLDQLKELMGIAAGDISQDAILSLYLDTALAAAKEYADKVNWKEVPLVLPSAINLGILRFVELSLLRKNNAGIQSESIAGMTQTFRNSDKDYFAEVYDIWTPYHTLKSSLIFRSARRAHQSFNNGNRRI